MIPIKANRPVERQDSLVICPCCGVMITSLPGSKPHHKWNGNMFDSRLVCPNNLNGVDGKSGKLPFRQPQIKEGRENDSE